MKHSITDAELFSPGALVRYKHQRFPIMNVYAVVEPRNLGINTAFAEVRYIVSWELKGKTHVDSVGAEALEAVSIKVKISGDDSNERPPVNTHSKRAA